MPRRYARGFRLNGDARFHNHKAWPDDNMAAMRANGGLRPPSGDRCDTSGHPTDRIKGKQDPLQAATDVPTGWFWGKCWIYRQPINRSAVT